MVPGRPMKAFRKRFCCIETAFQRLKHFLNRFLTLAEVFINGSMLSEASFWYLRNCKAAALCDALRILKATALFLVT